MTQDPNTPGQTPPPAGGTSMLDTAGGYFGPAPTRDEQNMGVLIYILGIVTWFLGPLIIWLLKKDTSKFVDDQGKEALNWGITLVIAYVALMIAGVVLHHIPFLGTLILVLAHLALFACGVIFNIMGAMACSKGTAYRYPSALRLIK